MYIGSVKTYVRHMYRVMYMYYIHSYICTDSYQLWDQDVPAPACLYSLQATQDLLRLHINYE